MTIFSEHDVIENKNADTHKHRQMQKEVYVHKNKHIQVHVMMYTSKTYLSCYGAISCGLHHLALVNLSTKW